LLVGLEVRRRTPDLLFAVIGGAWIGTRELNRWQSLCVEGIVLTAIAALHSVRGPSEDRRSMPVGPGLLVTCWVAVVVVLAVGTLSGAAAFGSWWIAQGVLIAWVIAVAAGGEAAGRAWGPGAAALAITAVPAAIALTAPLIGSPLFPEASGVALTVSPLVAAGRAMGIEVAQAAPLYELSRLGVTEFRYPSTAVHPALALLLAAGFLWRAARTRSRTCV
jgi:hypothetical protein